MYEDLDGFLFHSNAQGSLWDPLVHCDGLRNSLVVDLVATKLTHAFGMGHQDCLLLKFSLLGVDLNG